MTVMVVISLLCYIIIELLPYIQNAGDKAPVSIGPDAIVLPESSDTKYVQPICLPPTGDVQIGRKLPVVGMGSTETSNFSAVKLKVELPVVNTEQCKRVYSARNIEIGEGQMCAGGEAGKDSCRGDAGGPLMDWNEMMHDGKKRYNVVGIVSFGPLPCGSKDWPRVFTKVFHYISWTLETIKP